MNGTIRQDFKKDVGLVANGGMHFYGPVHLGMGDSEVIVSAKSKKHSRLDARADEARRLLEAGLALPDGASAHMRSVMRSVLGQLNALHEALTHRGQP